jgi:hypothetical protein
VTKQEFMAQLVRGFGSWSSDRDRKHSAWYDCLQEFAELQFNAQMRIERQQEKDAQASAKS